MSRSQDKIGVEEACAHPECSECHYVSPANRDGEKFICEECGHHEDADIDAAVVIANRARNKIGKPNLPIWQTKRLLIPVMLLRCSLINSHRV